MPGPATYGSDENVAVRARRQLDLIAESVRAMEAAQREVVGRLVELWPHSGWLAAGVRSARAWLQAHTGQSKLESLRLERIARLCSRDERLSEAVVEGSFPLGWAEALSRVVTDERARFLTDDVVTAMLSLPSSRVSDEQFGDVVRYWTSKADEELAPRRVQPHSLVACQTLFGGGEIHAQLAPAAFQNIMGAIDAFTQDPDPADAPYQRTLSERRADGLDDMASFATTHGGDSDDGCGLSHDDEEDDLADEPFDGTAPGDELEALRRHLRKRVLHRRRRAGRQVRPRSNGRVNVHIDFPTLTGQRGLADFDGLVLRGEGWNLHERNDGGPTVVGNGCLLCRFHHRLLHQYKWTLEPTDDGWIATDPHGTSWHERRPTDPAAA